MKRTSHRWMSFNLFFLFSCISSADNTILTRIPYQHVPLYIHCFVTNTCLRKVYTLFICWNEFCPWGCYLWICAVKQDSAWNTINPEGRTESSRYILHIYRRHTIRSAITKNGWFITETGGGWFGGERNEQSTAVVHSNGWSRGEALKGTTGYCMQASPLFYFSKILVHRPTKVLTLDLTASLRSAHFLLGSENFFNHLLGSCFQNIKSHI